MNTIINYIKNLFFKNKIIDSEVLKENKETYEDELLKKYGKCKETIKFGLKILFITDTHNSLSYKEEDRELLNQMKDFDVCILLGDYTANDLYEIVERIPKEKIFGILGNHDGWDRFDEFKIENINGKIIEVKGVKIAGIGGSYKYKDSDKYALYTHEESTEIADKLTEADILISHDKPYIEDNNDPAHDGLKGITYYLYKNHVPLHIHGHLHEDTENVLKNGTKSICLYKIKLLEL